MISSFTAKIEEKEKLREKERERDKEKLKEKQNQELKDKIKEEDVNNNANMNDNTNVNNGNNDDDKAKDRQKDSNAASANDKSTEKDKKKKKNKKKHKRKDHRKDDEDSSDYEGKEPTKKIKIGVLDNPNIPEELKQKYHEIEKNPLKVIVANIPAAVTVDELKGFFSTLITSLKPNLTSPPIISIEIGDTKNFAIFEFVSKDIADFALTLENLEYQGYRLTIQKSRIFFGKIYDPNKRLIDPFGNIITDATDLDNKIYMGGIPLYLKEEDIKKLCETCGMLKYFNLVKDSATSQTHKGYCFFEYLDPKNVEKAIKNLNNLEIGDRKLKVQRASSQSSKASQNQAQQPSNSSGSYLKSFPLFYDTQVQQMLNISLNARTPSRVIQLLNMVTPEDLMEDDVYNDLMDDVKKECSKFGPIEKIEIPRPDKDTGLVGPSVGKIFVKFQYLIPSKKARHNLAGRTYNRRTVVCSFYSEEKFDLKDYLIHP